MLHVDRELHEDRELHVDDMLYVDSVLHKIRPTYSTKTVCGRGWRPFFLFFSSFSLLEVNLAL